MTPAPSDARSAVPEFDSELIEHLDELTRQQLLPAELERKLVAEAQHGDAEARAQLIEAFVPLIMSVARNYRYSPAVDRLELLQEWVVGLLRAL